MYGIKELKSKIVVTDDTVECPVHGCTKVVPRQRKRFRRLPEFFCPHHNIFIGPSTFEYLNEEDNLLWRDPEDRAFLKAVYCHKRESRMARDNSEDALTWNVFRHLELACRLDATLSALSDIEVGDSQPAYWSYSHTTKSALFELNKARLEFGETIRRSSEPDLIITSNNTVFWIEAKLNATNDTRPSSTDQRKYLTGGKRWYHEVFTSDYGSVAVKAKRYELLRLWLLGSWMAADMGSKFVLINLVKRGREETSFAFFISQNDTRKFLCLTWEGIHSLIAAQKNANDEDRRKVLQYLENKSVGYERGALKAAFPMLLRGS